MQIIIKSFARVIFKVFANINITFSSSNIMKNVYPYGDVTLHSQYNLNIIRSYSSVFSIVSVCFVII